MENKTFNNIHIILIIILIIIFMGFIFSTLFENNSDYNTTKDYPIVQNIYAQKVDSDNNTKNNNSTVCTKINFSDWSLCSESGTRIRSLISAYPQGCKLSNDVIQQESCIYIPIELDAETLLQEIFQQISRAPDKTIETEYIGGEYGEVINVVKYAIASDNNLVIWVQSKDRQSNKVISDIFLRDSNKDFHPDIFSNDGAEWYPINIQSQDDQAQIMVVWTVQITYFAGNLIQ